MFVNLKKGTYRKKKSMPGTLYAVLKYWLEKLLNVEGPTQQRPEDFENEIPLPGGAINISVYLKKFSVHTHYCVQFWQC